MAIPKDRIRRSALLSNGDLYRYWLKRAWDDDARPMVAIGLNPSTADAERDDATVRRLMGFADREGCGSVTVVNLFALRSTDPAGLDAADDPVGPANDDHLAAALTSGGLLVAAWGDEGIRRGRGRVVAVTALIRKLGVPVWCLGRTNAGQPRHPLRLARTTPLEIFEGAPMDDRHPVTGIGYQGRDLAAFLAAVTELGAVTVVDVRKSPASRIRGFSRHVLAAALAGIDVAYRHEPALGNPPDNRSGFAADGDARDAAHDRFRALLAGADARAALDRIAADAAAGPVAVLCLEADQDRCHRALVLAALADRTPAPRRTAEVS